MITQEKLKSLLKYEIDGTFTNLTNRGAKAKIGQKTGSKHAAGYIQISLEGKRYLAHRLVWLYHTGTWPKNQLDHINCKKDDNRIENLRDVTPQQNHFNKPFYVKGFIKTKGGKYQARITKKPYRSLYIGTYDTEEEAHEAYIKAKASLHLFD